MSKQMLPILDDTKQKELLKQVQILKKQLEEIHHETRTFKALLHAHLSDLILEEQELFFLYKAIKNAKKLKRLEQKKRGKNYKEPTGILIPIKKKKDLLPLVDQKEKKRLYREAMLHVHPDKFTMSEHGRDLATDITRRLIDIYKTESLETLRAYHAHIFRGNSNIVLTDSASKVKVLSEDNYLHKEIEQLNKKIDLAKSQHIYKVKTDYNQPLDFIVELKIYYEDRIVVLKKRTRKGL